MTLDPVHFDGIAKLAERIDHDVDEGDHRDHAETGWNEFLDPLYDDGAKVIEPVGEQRRQYVDVEDIALRGDEFETVHGLDSGTINPTTFKNGLVIDIAQAAMSATPSELDLHRSRTVVATVHSNDATVDVGEDWEGFDEGFSQGRILQAPHVSRYEKGVVHALSLYLAESQHALQHADDAADLLILDGPVYPKGILNWLDRHQELAELLTTEETPRKVVENYVSLVERFVERDVPLVGFVKNVSAKGITETLRRKGTVPTPWANDAAFFSQVLERHDANGERATDTLSITNWFVSRSGPDRVFAANGKAGEGGRAQSEGFQFDRALEPELYEVTFCIIYDPREDMTYKVEAPYAFTKDEECRERLELQLLKDVAVERGPPLAVGKADELAHISRAEKSSLVETLEQAFDSDRDRSYDQLRWDIDY